MHLEAPLLNREVTFVRSVFKFLIRNYDRGSDHIDRFWPQRGEHEARHLSSTLGTNFGFRALGSVDI